MKNKKKNYNKKYDKFLDKKMVIIIIMQILIIMNGN